jgi:hypothetical protein
VQTDGAAGCSVLPRPALVRLHRAFDVVSWQMMSNDHGKQLCEAVFRTLEIHGKPQALKGRPAEMEEK